MPSIFTRIIAGELPSYKVFEDDKIIAILAKDQINLGHTLVIPKQEVNHWCDVPDDLYAHLHKVSLKIGRALKQATGCTRVLTAAVGYEVPHYHLHLIPSWSMADLNFAKAQSFPEGEVLDILEKIKKDLN